MRPGTEVADVLRSNQAALSDIVPNSWKRRCLYALMRCRTAAMGGHVDRCDNKACKKLHISYNSCRNRHCTKGQGHLREQWIQSREKDLLNTSYFHVVFTLPDLLHPLALLRPELIYGLLFKTAWSVIRDFGNNSKFLGAQIGMIAVLHTWRQNLCLHPHLHCIVPAGGVTKSGKWKNTKSKGKFLFPVKQMCRVFRARYVETLRKEVKMDGELSQRLFKKPWVIYCKQPFYGPKQAIEYLGRYTHKVAISNSRILSVANGKVSFRAKDYRKAGKKVVLKIDEREFIRRFALHVLPKGFTKMRHYGVLSSTSKKRCKEQIDGQLGKVVLAPTKTPMIQRQCPVCKLGILVTVFTFD